MAQMLGELRQTPTWEGLLRWTAFPKLVLRAAARRGTRHPKQAQEEVARRLRLWSAGLLDELWLEAEQAGAKRAPPGATTRKRQTDEEGPALPRSVVTAVEGLIDEGALSKAAKHLVSEGLADSGDADVRQRLRDLHPPPWPRYR